MATWYASHGINAHDHSLVIEEDTGDNVAVVYRGRKDAHLIAAAPERSKMTFTVDLGSATLGVPEVDMELPKPVWFDVPRFPQASFTATLASPGIVW